MSQLPEDAGPLSLFTIDPQSDLPPFRQLFNTAMRAVSQGKLSPGQRLPTTRALATHLGLAINTVAAAYRALEESGIVEGRGRAGTFVSLGEDPVAAAARQIAIEAVTQLRALGVEEVAVKQYLSEAVNSSR